MKNFYEIIGTSENAIKRKSLELARNKKLTNKQIDDLVDQFVKEKYENALKLLEMKKKINEGKVLKQLELQQAKKELMQAYKQIASKTLRNLYCYDRENRESGHETEKPYTTGEKIIRFDKIPTRRDRTAYEILGTLEETMGAYSDQENDRRIKERLTKLLKSYTEELHKTEDFRIRIRLQTMITDIKNSYQLIETAEKRKEYGELLQQRKKEKNIENKYSHKEEYDSSLVHSEKNRNSKSLWNKMLIRIEKQEEARRYPMQDGKEIEIRKTGEVHFLNWGKGKMNISEYEITRIIEGEERKDIIYTNSIKPSYLSIDKKTGEPIFPEYYDGVFHELLAEEAIEGSKHNGGYIGEVEKDKDGNYVSSLRNKKLRPMEQECLTAIIMLQKREEMQRENYKEKGAEK